MMASSSSALACVAVHADAGGSGAATTAAPVSSLPGLQLLLRILPFRSSVGSAHAPTNSQQQQQKQLKLPSHEALEELHRHPLWRYGSTAAQWPGPRHSSNRPLAPAEAQSALLAYVRMASDAEQLQGLRRATPRHHHQLSDIAAELHALYTLAAIHVSHQQQQDGGSGRGGSAHPRKQSLTEGDVMQLLKAYATLEDCSSGSSSSSSPQRMEAWGSKAQAAAAAVEALYAFARLADPPQQPQQQQGLAAADEEASAAAQQDHHHQQQQQQQAGSALLAPGQLQADSSHAVQAFKQLASAGGHSAHSSSRQGAARGSGSSSSASGDLQVLLKLAQLGLHGAAS